MTMANKKEIIDIPLDDLLVAKGQVRTRDIQKGVEELADSIRVQGLLEPIVVCESDKKGRYEILAGQRRFLAVKSLGWKTIEGVLRTRKDDVHAKVLSLTENLMRRDVTSKEKIDACTFLYEKYGSIKDVADETGLPASEVRVYVKAIRLVPKLKKLVEKGEINVNVALRAQDAAAAGGEKPDPDEAVKLAKEMSSMTGNQRKRVQELRQADPETPVDDVIEEAKTGEKSEQILVTISSSIKRSLRAYADSESVTQDEAAANLIEEGLTAKGFGG